jgi:adenylate cyclase
VLTLDAIRPCFEGAIPSAIATCDPDGVPNVSYLSQVEYVDAGHVALSFQFFNTTRRNILANPRATVLVSHPVTGANYRLAVDYLRTETSGPLFERMKAKLAGVASHEGMSSVFRLRGADVYRVAGIEEIPGDYAAPVPARNLLAATRRVAERLAAATDLKMLLDEMLAGLDRHFGIRHAMVLLHDAPGRRLFTVASHGYAGSGAGAEIAVGDGVIGVAAAELTPVRIGFMAPEYAYGRVVREVTAASDLGGLLETEIPFPGLAEPHSQLAVPVISAGRLVGVVYVESVEDLHFGYDDEEALVALAGQLGAAIGLLQAGHEPVEEGAGRPVPAPGGEGAPVTVRRYAVNDSVFLGDDYLIKGVAGAIFWRLVSEYASQQRSEFTNRELRLDPRLRLPDVVDNLEARLILLERRLNDRGACVRIEKTGRGRFRLRVLRPLELVEIPAGP